MLLQPTGYRSARGASCNISFSRQICLSGDPGNCEAKSRLCGIILPDSGNTQRLRGVIPASEVPLAERPHSLAHFHTTAPLALAFLLAVAALSLRALLNCRTMGDDRPIRLDGQ